MKIPHKAVAVFRVRTEHLRHWETGKALRIGCKPRDQSEYLSDRQPLICGAIRLCGPPESWMMIFPVRGKCFHVFQTVCEPVADGFLSAELKIACSLSRRPPPPQAAAFIILSQRKAPRRAGLACPPGRFHAGLTFYPGSPGRKRPGLPARPASGCRIWDRRAPSSASFPCGENAAGIPTVRCCPRLSAGWADH